MTLDEAKTWLNKLYARADITDEYGSMEDMQPYEEAVNMAIRALEQEPNTWNLDDAREDFIYDVYNTLDFLPTNNEANRIIDSFDRVISDIEYNILNKIREEIEPTRKMYLEMNDIDWLNGCDYVLKIIDKYREESEVSQNADNT